jgi:eukaryotic-like serine/threonine-protein kinase
MERKPGDKFGPYELVSLIGKGGMGEVWKGRDTRLQRDVAIKFCANEFSGRFKREAKAIAALNHPNICTLYDIGPDYLVMEYIEGAPPRGPLAPSEALRLALGIAAGLEAAHARGITHRDLKPANILVTQSGLKLLDFGLALVDDRAGVDIADAPTALSVAGAVMGTVAYMSPEQAQGKPADARSDIFSFGLVLHEMLSGRQAFAANSAGEIMAAIMRDEPAPLDAPAKLFEIVARCLRKSPAARFQTMSEVRTALEQAAATPVSNTPSMAVLPFVNMSRDVDDEYFSDGLAEEIINSLAQIQGLKVIARTSAFAFKGKNEDIRRIAETLGVTNVLEGSVRRSGNRLRITAQLIHAADGTHLWSQRYDREMRDVFDIQDEVAQAIVEALKVELGTRAGKPLVKRYTENPEAHSLYLKGNFHLYRFTPEDLEKGRECLEKAVALEPGYAPAWIQLVDYHIARSFFHVLPLQEWPKALEAARRAVAADETLAEAHAALGWVEALSEYRWPEALHRFATALRLNPASARTRFWHSTTLHCLGRAEESLAEAQRAVELDPLSPLFREIIAIFCMWSGRQDRAVEHLHHALDINPDYPDAIVELGEAYCRLGRYEEGIALLEKARRLLVGEYYPLGFLGWAYVRAGRRNDADRFLAELEEKRRRQYVPAGTIAFAALALDDLDAAFRWADKAIEERDPGLPYLIRAPEFRALRGDPRYQNLLRQMNLA